MLKNIIPKILSTKHCVFNVDRLSRCPPKWRLYLPFQGRRFVRSCVALAIRQTRTRSLLLNKQISLAVSFRSRIWFDLIILSSSSLSSGKQTCVRLFILINILKLFHLLGRLFHVHEVLAVEFRPVFPRNHCLDGFVCRCLLWEETQTKTDETTKYRNAKTRNHLQFFN